jgi:hypothetical protein
VQFNNEDEVQKELDIADEVLTQKNEKVSISMRTAHFHRGLIPVAPLQQQLPLVGSWPRGTAYKGLTSLLRQCSLLGFNHNGVIASNLRCLHITLPKYDGAFLWAPDAQVCKVQALASQLAHGLFVWLHVQCGGKLQRSMSGKVSTVFAHILRGLSGAKITRAKEEVFRNITGGGSCVRCSYKADDGFLYPLDKAFFYVHKPPMCINHRWVCWIVLGYCLGLEFSNRHNQVFVWRQVLSRRARHLAKAPEILTPCC